MSNLSDKHCVPCEGGTTPLSSEESKKILSEIPATDGNWTLVDDKELEKTYTFKDFKEALEFVNKVGAIAESEGHHPDIGLHNYKLVTIKLSTHAIGGLSENDFILASKIDDLLR
jgi:4a-hydroxytetrahydrobiopterin dehydratase